MDHQLTEEQIRTSMQDPRHLERWASETRPFLIPNSKDLVKSLQWPEGHIAFQGVAYAVVEMVAAPGVGEKHQHPEQQQNLDREDGLTGLPRVVHLTQPIGQLRKEVTEDNRQLAG